MPSLDYYQILGVPRTATQDAIRKAYKKLARENHPDIKPGDKAALERFKQVREAYEVLSDKQSRHQYDQSQPETPKSPPQEKNPEPKPHPKPQPTANSGPTASAPPVPPDSLAPTIPDIVGKWLYADSTPRPRWQHMVLSLVMLLTGLWLRGGSAPVEPTQYSPPPLTPVVPTSDSLTGTKPGEVREITLPGSVKLKQVWCPSGKFTMGSPASETGRSKDEDDTADAGGQPALVTLTKGFWLGQTEVTQAQWTAVMGAASKPWSGKPYVREGANFPASFISHGVNSDGTIEADSATAFCEKLTEIERKAGRLATGWKYALPTEAQWEYACRAGTQTAYSFGDDESKLGDHAWWGGNLGDGNAKTEQYAHAVATKQPNAWGLSDMHGNVWEWCFDGYAEQLIGGRDPANTSQVDGHVLRGGSWFEIAAGPRSAARIRDRPDFLSDYDSGFRVSRTQ